MKNMLADAGDQLHRRAALLIASGFGVILVGAALQVFEARLNLMTMLGLEGTVFGLWAKLGGALALVGLALLAFRVAGPAAEPPAPIDRADGPNDRIHSPSRQVARTAAALKRSRKGQAA